MTTVSNPDAVGVTDTRERILNAAYPLFARQGIRNVTIEQILENAALNAETFTHHFESKDELAAACLQLHEREWTVGTIEAGARARGESPEECLLAVFDVLDEWFARDDHESFVFTKVLLELGKDHPLGAASARHLVHLRDMVARMADAAQLTDPGSFALSFHILMKGAILAALEGDRAAARRAKTMVTLLIKEFTPPMRAIPLLQVAETDDLNEWLVLDDMWERGEPAAAIIRNETDGTYYYPNTAEFARVGPHPSLDDAFRSFRDDAYPELW